MNLQMSQKRIIVVLGMHRSGTSAIARALKALGVNLGDRLMAATKDNERGYWEDLDIYALNIDLLEKLGHDWHTLTPVLADELMASQAIELKPRAVEILKKRFSNSDYFGLKDPRLPRLLPFWQGVFAELQIAASYVITCRNPVSVVHSLQQRDGFAREKGYYLWLEHTLSSLTQTEHATRIVVDYDLLLDGPLKQLQRISTALDLDFDEKGAAIVEYQQSFLTSVLRHNYSTIADLQQDKAAPASVLRLYKALVRVARGRVSPVHLRGLVDELNALQRENYPALRYMRNGDDKVTTLEAEVVERDGQISGLSRELKARESRIEGLSQALVERDEGIANLTQATATMRASYQAHVAELEKAVDARRRDYLTAASEATTLRSQLKTVMTSWSWKMTAPMRRSSTIVRGIRAEIFSRGVFVYRLLPIEPVKKQKLKNVIFHLFGFALGHFEVYQRWKVYRQIQPERVKSKPAAPTKPATTATPAAISTPPSADGVWEWADYNIVKSRISNLKSQRLSQVTPSPLDLIDVGDDHFAHTAAQVNIPASIAVPDVSIILPVFNNLKYTLECLLSISAHHDPSISYEIIVADDASTDETAKVVKLIPNLRYIRNGSNLGFLQNCNRALKHVRGNYILYLNNDVQVTDGWLRALLETFHLYPKVGAVGPRFIYPSGHLQEAGASFRPDGTADMVGLNENPSQARFSYTRRVDYVSGACLMLPTSLAKQLGGFSEDYLPCYCEDSDLCLRVQEAGYYVYCNPAATVVHHLSKTTEGLGTSTKLRYISKNLVTFQKRWHDHLDGSILPKVIAFYLPQFYPFPENDRWWGTGFTEWSNVTKAQPNFVGHYQPRLPADLGFYDLRLPEVMFQQAELARRYGVGGFCFYYYWFGGKRLLDRPIERMLASGQPDFPFCLCWANENWTRRWDGQDREVLMAQSHSADDDKAAIMDLTRFFRDHRYIRIDKRPLILVYRVSLFPNFAETSERWRAICREQGIGEIYIAMVESFDLVHANTNPKKYGCDAAVEFPPQEYAEPKLPTGDVINPDYAGTVADYRDLAVRYVTRDAPAYIRFRGVIPGWDNTARRQNNSFCFEHATPGGFQAWLEEAIEQTRIQHYGDERLVFVNAWNEWAEGAYLEPDRKFGHTYLEAVKNALEATRLLRKDHYGLGN